MTSHNPMDEKYWKKRIERSIKRIGRDKLISSKQEIKLIKQLRRI